MSELLSAVFVISLAYLATNSDNLLLLLGLMTVTDTSSKMAAFGYLLSVSVVVGLSLTLGEALEALGTEHLRWVGLVPLGMGVWLGVRAFRSWAGAVKPASALNAAFWSSFGTSLAHSTDSFAVYGPLFAETKSADLIVMVVTLGLLALAAVFAARSLATHPRIGSWLRRVAPRVVPVFLIVVGVYILMDSPTDMQ